MNSIQNAHLKLIGMAVLWGASWPAGKVLAQAAPPLTASAWRFSVAVVVLLVWLAISNKGLPKLTLKQSLGMMLGGAVGVFGYAYFFMAGLNTVAAGRASLVVTLNPVVTTLLAVWLFREKLNAKIGAGMFLAACGALTVLSHGEPWKLLAGDIGYGELLLLGCVATWSGYSLIGKALLQGVPALTATTYTSCAGVVLLWGAVWMLEPASNPFAVSGTVQVAVLFLALGATVLAYVWYFNGISQLGAGAAAGYISLVPVFGVISATLLLGETMDGSLIAGGALAVGGVVLMNRGRDQSI